MATVSNIATNASHSPTKRSRTLARAGIAAVSLLAVAIFVPSSLADWLAVDQPLLATRIAPWNATAAANAAAALKNPQNPQARALVRRVLARDLTQIPAIELRALDLTASGKVTEARSLFDLSNRLSRRNLPTRLWLIQDAVDHGNVAGALKNFDIALRTTTAAQPILFPILARAAADPTLTGQLAELFDRPSDWRQMFFEWAFSNERDVRPIASVIAQMKDKDFVAANGDDQRLVERLVTAGDFFRARLLHERFRAHEGNIADSHFGDARARYPFGWGLVSNGSLGAERTLSGSSATLTYRAAPANSGQVAAQLLTLAPGRYRLATEAAARGTGAAPYWAIVCGENGHELARLDQPMIADGMAETAFSVPDNCEGQWLTLTLRPAPDASPQSGSIAWVAVSRSN